MIASEYCAFRASQVALVVKSPTCQCREIKRCRFNPGSGRSPRRSLEEDKATHCSIFVWRIPWIEEPGGPQSPVSQRVRHNWTDLACLHCTFNNKNWAKFMICGLGIWGRSDLPTKEKFQGVKYLQLEAKWLITGKTPFRSYWIKAESSLSSPLFFSILFLELITKWNYLIHVY